MRKWAALFWTASLIIIIFATLLYAQEEIDLLDSSGLYGNQRSAVIFLHDEHNETAQIEECNECHHVYEEGKKLGDESSEDQSCADCHEEQSSGAMPGLREAFHLNCKGCHQDIKKGPVMCGQCHQK